MHLFLKLFILVKLTTCFGRSLRSIIRSSRLHIQQHAYVKELLLPAAGGEEMERSSVSSPLAAGSYSPLTCAFSSVCSLDLLVMDGKTV